MASTAAGISKTVDVTVARMAPNLTGGIVDPDTQYTQKRFDEVKALTTNNRALKAWKNDKVNSEISLAAVGTTVSNLTVTANDLTSQGGDVIAKSNVTATFIKSTKAYNGSYLGYGDPNREVPAATETNRSERHPLPKRPDHGEGQSGAEHLGIVRHTEGRQGRHLHHHADRHRRRDGNAAHIHLHHRGEGRYAARSGRV